MQNVGRKIDISMNRIKIFGADIFSVENLQLKIGWKIATFRHQSIALLRFAVSACLFSFFVPYCRDRQR